jgi:spore maturation protein CgeB
MDSQKILFVGDLNVYGRSFQRFRTLRDLGNFLVGVSTVSIPFRPGLEKSSLIERILWKLGMPYDVVGANSAIKKEMSKMEFDLVWIDKGMVIYPSTLNWIKKKFPKCFLIFCSEDDMFAKHNRTSYFDRGISFYDFIFTTKVYNLEELKTIGAKETVLMLDSYDEKNHLPLELSIEDRNTYQSEVGFIGSFEEDRAKKILYLAENGILVNVWGNGWSAWLGKHKNLVIKNKMLFEQEYTKAICATKINLCFLRKINRDEVTSRSVEIPACGAFMLGERTKRHLDFFKEGKEAEFFSSNEEMLSKVRFYMDNEELRKNIATAGRKRCLESGYSMRVQIKNMLEGALSKS